MELPHTLELQRLMTNVADAQAALRLHWLILRDAIRLDTEAERRDTETPPAALPHQKLT